MSYYRMHRGWMDNEAFTAFGDEPYCERTAWIWLIENAAWKDTKIRCGSAMVPLTRGQLLVSLRFVAEAWGWHRNRVHRFLGLLKSESMIGTEIGTGRTLITICNYDKFQSDRDSDGTDEQQQTGHARDSDGTNKKKDKKVKKEEEDSEADASDAGSPDPAEEVWTKGLAIVGEKRRSLLGKLRKEYGEVALLEAIIETEHECPIDPLEYLIGCCRQRKSNGRDKRSPVEKLYAGAMAAADEVTRRQMAEREEPPDGGSDKPPTLALLDGGRSGGKPALADRRLAHGFGKVRS